MKKRNKEQEEQIEALKSKVLWLQKQVFGTKTEKESGPVAGSDGGGEVEGGKKAKRGKQPGSKGYGRKDRPGLPIEEVVHELSQEQRKCPVCGKAGRRSGSKESVQIHWEVRLCKRIHKRQRYVFDCSCRQQANASEGAVAAIAVAPCAPKLFSKGLFSIGFWTQVLIEKFLLQRPLHRIGKLLELEGCAVSGGTLTAGLKKMLPLMQPLYAGIVQRNRSATHWHMDETGWKVFCEIEAKSGHQWWLWVVATTETVVYLLDPSRSSQVPLSHFPEEVQGIISADRYCVYKSLKNMRVAFCWSHVRRDFLKVSQGPKKLRQWAQGWLCQINQLFGLNAARRKLLEQPEGFAEKQKQLVQAVEQMRHNCEQELSDPELAKPKRKLLKSLKNHWDGLTLFVDNAPIPMDNNKAERLLRNPVVGRKNYYGSGSEWSGQLAAMLFTLFETLQINHLNPKGYLLAYLHSCAENQGRAPESIESWLPWNLSPQQKESFCGQEHPP